MKTNSLNKQLAALIRKHDAYMEYQNHVQSILREKVDFQCAIVHQPDDGFCLLNEEGDGMLLAPLDVCLSVIYRNGRLTRDEHERLCI